MSVRWAAPIAGQIAKFILVGVANTLLTLGTIFLLSGVAHADYRLANGVGYIIGLMNSFLLNRWWTFKSRGAVPLQMAKFFLVFGFCYAVQFGMLVLMVDRLAVSSALSQVAAMAVYTSISYLLNKHIVYR